MLRPHRISLSAAIIVTLGFLVVASNPPTVVLRTTSAQLSPNDFPAAATTCVQFVSAYAGSFERPELTPDQYGIIEYSLGFVQVGSDPGLPVYDSADGFLYVPNEESANVSVVQNYSAIASVPVGTEPVEAIYDSGNAQVYILNSGSNNVTVLSGTASVGSIGTGLHPQSGAYDYQNGYVYVANTDGTLTVIDGTSAIASVRVGTGPSSLGVDPIDGDVYVPNRGSNNVSVINGTRLIGSIDVGANPQSAMFDSRDGLLYVANAGSGNVSVIDDLKVVESVNVGGTPYSVTVDPWTGDVYVPNPGSGNTSLINGTQLMGSVQTNGGVQAVYNPADGDVFIADPGSDAVDVVNGTGTIYQVGLFSLSLPAPYVMSGENGASDPENGLVYISGLNSKFIAAIFVPASYPITFTETGLPPGTNWSARLEGQPHWSTGTSITLNSSNGTVGFGVGVTTGYGPDPAWGFITVKGGHPVIPVRFHRVYSVTFNEQGLPPDSEWWVTLAGNSSTFIFAPPFYVSYEGALNCSAQSNSTVEFLAWNGTYTYSASPNSGSITVNGTDVSISIQFTRNETVVGIPQFDQYVIVGSLAATGVAAVAATLCRRRNVDQD